MANNEMKRHEMHPKGKQSMTRVGKLSKQAARNRYRKSKGRR